MALEHFKASTFTSYTEITPEGSMVLLVFEQKETPAGKTWSTACLAHT